MTLPCFGQGTEPNINKFYPGSERFEEDIQNFEILDKKQLPPQSAIVCIGSSSMLGWHKTIRDDLAPLTIIPRGFGGSNMNDLLHFSDRIVLPYKPRAVVIYEGDNDIAQGIAPKEIADTFRVFIKMIHKELPECRIYFISIKPSLARWDMWAKMQEANSLIAAECTKDKRLTFVDVASGMLNDKGKPRKEIFQEDSLHMTRDGYVIWRNVLRPVLFEAELQFEPQEDSATFEEKIALMVTSLTPKGWELYDNVLRFIPENLYEHINGRAEYYLSFNMITMTFASFRKSTNNSNFINLSIFDMSNPSNAFGVFSGERSLGAPPLKLGRDAYRSKGNYYIWHGQYYIQIIASDTISELRRIGMDLAEKLTDHLQDSGQPVWGLKALPVNNRVPQSVQYFLIDALGYSFLTNTYTAKYYKDKIEVSVFLSQQDSIESVNTIIAKLKEHVNKYGKGVDLLSVDGIELLSCDMGKYYDVIFQKGCLAAGVTGVKDKELAIGAAIELWKQLQTD